MPENSASLSSHRAWSLRRAIAVFAVAGWACGAVTMILLRQFASGAAAARAEVAPDALLILGALALPAAALAAFGLGVWRRSARALQASAQQLEGRPAGEAQMLSLDRLPAELVPLAGAFNAALSRLEQACAEEGRFCSAAAHELRTPLAAIKIQVQLASLARGDAERRQAAERAMSAIDQATHMVDQLRILSRIDGMAVLRMHAVRLQLASIASQVIEDLRPIAARRGQGIECRLAAAPIDGLEFAVGVLLRNLIDNAMRYGPDSGTVRVSTASEPSGAVLLQVEDSGPGIAPADHERVFQRFQRLASDEEGCGIGLSIVRAVVDLHRAGVELGRSDLGGLRVTVRFPAPSAELGHAGIRAPAGQEPAAA